MAVTIKVLASNRLTSSAATKQLYLAQSTTPAQSGIVKTMRFSNVSGVTLTLNVYFQPSGSTYPTNARRILPKDLSLAVGATFIDDTELTLGPGDSIYAVGSAASGTNWAECVISGEEREA
jgi:hypothetical protein